MVGRAANLNLSLNLPAQICEESGTDLAKLVLKATRSRAKATERSAVGDAQRGTEQAVGRIVGSLCVLSARKEDAESAMLASWVSQARAGTHPAGPMRGAPWLLRTRAAASPPAALPHPLPPPLPQASFNPPALTVAVSKDRAVDGLVLPGAAFVLNVVAAGQEKPVYKARACAGAPTPRQALIRPDMLCAKNALNPVNVPPTPQALAKEFAPGEDRFGGLEVRRSERSGCAVLPGVSAAFVECTVTDRMEAGDHWVRRRRREGGRCCLRWGRGGGAAGRC